MANKIRYDAFTKSYRSSNSRDVVMPGPTIHPHSDNNFVNGAPFGPYDPNKPVDYGKPKNKRTVMD